MAKLNFSREKGDDALQISPRYFDEYRELAKEYFSFDSKTPKSKVESAERKAKKLEGKLNRREKFIGKKLKRLERSKAPEKYLQLRRKLQNRNRAGKKITKYQAAKYRKLRKSYVQYIKLSYEREFVSSKPQDIDASMQRLRLPPSKPGGVPAGEYPLPPRAIIGLIESYEPRLSSKPDKKQKPPGPLMGYL